MKCINFNQYWTYFTTKNKSNFMFGTFNIPEYEDYLLVYLNNDIVKTDFPKELLKDVEEETFNYEANFLMKYFTLEERQAYFDIIEKNIGTDAYLLYKIKFNKSNIDKLLNFLKPKSECNLCEYLPNCSMAETYIKKQNKKESKMVKNSPEYRDRENINDPVFYIVLRNDLDLSTGQQAVYIAQMTAAITEDIRFKFNYNNITYLNFVDLKDNVIILQASDKDLFEDNYIPTHYDNENIIFNYLTDEENKVAHSNFRLGESKIVALGYYGIKKDMPKFLRKLKLYGD